jgi:probable phosphoglycerate mutase
MLLYIIRHAEPDYEHDTITPEGHEEAKALAERLAGQGVDLIYSSPLGRAIATMKYTAELLKLEYAVEAWTREIPGLFDGATPWGALTAWDIPGEAVRGGENFPSHEDWHERPYIKVSAAKAIFDTLKVDSDAFFARHGYVREGGRYRRVAPHGKKIAVFCHGGLGLTWLSHLLELPLPLVWTGFWLPPSSVTTILFEERSDDWAVPRCIGMGDVSHLYKAGLPVKRSGLLANAT